MPLARAHPLEAHLSGAIVAQRGPKDQPALASIGAVPRNGNRRIYALSKYLSTCFLAQHLLKAYLLCAVGEQSTEPQHWDVCIFKVARSCPARHCWEGVRTLVRPTRG